jgi:hypothetical protein
VSVPSAFAILRELLFGNRQPVVDGDDYVPHLDPETVLYRTRDGGMWFRFRLERQTDGIIRVVIVEQPAYRGRPDAAHDSHRLRVGGAHCICWSGPLTTIEDALGVAAEWSECTANYILRGSFSRHRL